MQNKSWHNKSLKHVLEVFNVIQETGLSSDEVKVRQNEYGLNELVEQKTRNVVNILWEQFTATMVLILIIAAIVSMFLLQWLEAFSILAIVILFRNTGLKKPWLH
jgi:Ca2+-transporting ATPase